MPTHPRFGDFLYRFSRQISRCEHGLLCPYCCWEWLGAKNARGYGVISIKTDGKWKTTLAHQLAWKILHGRPIPKGLFALHHCDNPPCCNGIHIYPGTQLDNIRDAVRRGRHSYGISPNNFGENNSRAKLTEKDIPLIFQWRAEGHTQQSIANTLGVSRRAIGHVLNHATWVRSSPALPLHGSHHSDNF